MSTTAPPEYALGSDDAEIARLDLQAASIAAPTAFLLGAAGIAPGMRVLDLGTGLGHVAFAVGDMVGPSGFVLGVDQSERPLAVAEERRSALGRDNIRFQQVDVHQLEVGEQFDALVARLLLFHLPDAVDVVHSLLRFLKPGGRVVAIEFDIGTARSEPELPLVTETGARIEAAFRAAGADPRIGAHIALMLEDAGLTGVETFGLQVYLRPDDPRGPALFAGVTRSLSHKMLSEGIATEEELGLATLEQRLSEDVAAARAVVLPPGVVGAWGFRPQ